MNMLCLLLSNNFSSAIVSILCYTPAGSLVFQRAATQHANSKRMELMTNYIVCKLENRTQKKIDSVTMTVAKWTTFQEALVAAPNDVRAQATVVRSQLIEIKKINIM
jgi:hypothetical protein